MTQFQDRAVFASILCDVTMVETYGVAHPGKRSNLADDDVLPRCPEGREMLGKGRAG